MHGCVGGRGASHGLAWHLHLPYLSHHPTLSTQQDLQGKLGEHQGEAKKVAKLLLDVQQRIPQVGGWVGGRVGILPVMGGGAGPADGSRGSCWTCSSACCRYSTVLQCESGGAADGCCGGCGR